ncbi:purine-nucleoside phosphorylase [Seinonella peptonophila]|uniref:Purine nucleoside phosphorylase n=1 Tax=Seinonella peptonophila TaxID=112248 RepID=A0A1M4TJY8_9BACL|nr:purine-nucleoside phosphorylase [Seinonella peptonophila]SHE44822.1 purine-nucleoside phosphorylase [Seinonella peptonophila]
MKQIADQITAAVSSIEKQLDKKPEIGLILGSGLGDLAQLIKQPTIIPYNQIPHFPQSTVEGHAGQFVFGELEGKQVLIMQGRVHLYEGHQMEQVTFPIRVMKKLGIHTLIVTNAAGGINQEFASGALMLIRDHINFMGQNPLVGPNDDEVGLRFPDMTYAYRPALRQQAKQVASEMGVTLEEGVYVGVLGPSYETPAEIRMFRQWGADAVGMSTVPEVIVAHHAGIHVLGISCITNMAAGILDQPLHHTEVMETAERVHDQFMALVQGIIRKIEHP